jgi:hypothetical protein
LPVGACSVVEDIAVESFPTSHDAVSPCGYLLSAGGCRVSVVIDSGEVTPTMLAAMQQADLLILEANHDRERLLRGPYPQSLKRRILSATGHLSNDQAADAVLRTWRADGVRWLWLSHLSRTNNTPILALKSVRARLQAANANLSQLHISVSPPGMGGVWDSTQLWHSPSLWEMPGWFHAQSAEILAGCCPSLSHKFGPGAVWFQVDIMRREHGRSLQRQSHSCRWSDRIMRNISTPERGELEKFLFLIQLGYWQAVEAESGGDFAAVMNVML